jgi:hypothetical protein
MLLPQSYRGLALIGVLQRLQGVGVGKIGAVMEAWKDVLYRLPWKGLLNSGCTVKKKRKFSSYILKFRRDRVQSYPK